MFPWCYVKRLKYLGKETEDISILGIVNYLHKCTSLMQFEWRITGLKNLDDFAKLTNLTELNLLDCYRLKNMDGLTTLTNLTKLVLEDCHNLQVVPLTNLTKLRLTQHGEYYTFDSVDALAILTKLTELHLEGFCSLTNVNVLSKLTNLTSLNFQQSNSGLYMLEK